ncbi:MAG: nitroreductase family protein [Planctomycetota bacterium]
MRCDPTRGAEADRADGIDMETNDSIRKRRTLKVLADPTRPFAECDGEMDGTLRELMETAGHAPFHYPASEHHRDGPLDSMVPWRFHALPSSVCRSLVEWSEGAGIAVGKMNSMLSAAKACVLVTWLPDPSDDATEFQAFEPSRRNMEHIAAASAAVQNLLLASTERGLESYWSSGGHLRTEIAYRHLGIPEREVLLGSIFLFPSDAGDAPTKPGALRERRGPLESWARVLRVDELGSGV